MRGNRTGKGWFKKGQANPQFGRKKILSDEERKKHEFVAHYKYVKRKAQELKNIIYGHYGNKCACCGETQPMFLSIDHVNNDGYRDRKRGFKLYKRIIRDAFPDKYQILCMNCNWGKSRNKGICPHKDVK